VSEAGAIIITTIIIIIVIITVTYSAPFTFYKNSGALQYLCLLGWKL